MSSASNKSRRGQDRVDSRLSRAGWPSRPGSRAQLRQVSTTEAYTHALGVAYLAHLLQPRQRRLQHVSVPAQQLARSSTTSSINELVKDLSLVRDSKSTKLPHGFMADLERRLQGVLTGKERRQEFNDAAVKRTFAVFYTAFTEQNFRRQMEKDRRVEDLVLIFFSSATKELQKGKASSDDGWKLMVDRHVALFVRLLSTTLKEHDWGRDRPELASRLTTLESKLLKHDQDLAAASQRAGGAGGTTVEVELPPSYEARDMPLALIVAERFGLSYDQVQADINRNRPVWTPKAALADLKSYQNLVNLHSPAVLRPDDFDLDEAYEAWRKTEGSELSQMMLAILRTDSELTRSSDASTRSTSATWDGSRRTTDPATLTSPLTREPPDMSDLRLQEGGENAHEEGVSNHFTFFPPDPKAYYRCVLAQVLTHDLNQAKAQQGESQGDAEPPPLLSKDSTVLLQEISMRWRIPQWTRLVLFLDVIREKFVDQDVTLDDLDAAFEYVNSVSVDSRRASVASLSEMSPFLDRSKWSMADFALMQRVLSALHDALLRDLYDILQHCYEPKPPTIGPVMYVLENHVRSDPAFAIGRDGDARFEAELSEGLRQRALDVYSAHLRHSVPENQDEWGFVHVVELGKTILKLAERIQKRYKKNPEIMGVNPLTILLGTVLPAYEGDAGQLIERIIVVARSHDEEIDIAEGFDLYKELVEIRRVHMEALPG